ncbi:MAG: phosphatidate cytidylyltransferase [Eubacteriales bacterium]
MKIRVISSVLGLPIAFFAIIYGGLTLLGVISIISLIGLIEFYKAFEIKCILLYVIGLSVHISYSILIALNKEEDLMYLISLFLLILLAAYVLNYSKINITNVLVVFFGFFYVSYLLSHIYFVREFHPYGYWVVWLIFISAWGTDTFAYLTGLSIGKNKLAPILSPKKTIEGSIGGIIGAVILSIIFGFIFINSKNETNSYVLYFAIITGVGSIISQIGDLAASAIKRNVKIKDYGQLIPGHGGILDRFDSILFTAPFVFLIAYLLF